MQLNITSLQSNAEVLEAICMAYRPMVLSLQEIEVQTTAQLATTLLQNYRVVSFQPRKAGDPQGACAVTDDAAPGAGVPKRGRRGGGVATLVRRDVLPYESADLGRDGTIGTDFEYSRSVVRGVTMVNVYAPPTCSLSGLDELVAATMESRKGELVLCGDFNASHDLWNSRMDPTRRCHMKSRRGDALYEVLVKHRLILANSTEPTTSNGSVLDLTFGTAGALGEAHEVVPRLVSGVHYPLLYDLRTKEEDPGGKRTRRMRSIIPNGCEERFAACLDTMLEGVPDSLPAHDIDRLADHIRGAVHEATGKEGKRFNAASKKSQNWIGEEWLDTDDPAVALTESRQELIAKRNEHFRHLIGQFGEKGGYNPKHLYDVLKLLNRDYPTSLYTGPDAPSVAAEKLRELFAHGDAKETEGERRKCRKLLDSRCAAIEAPPEVTDAEITTAILSLKPQAAGGPDGISTKQIICAGKSKKFRESMARLATNALKLGKVPRGWKKATIVPIEKEGGGYRPVSLINVADKVVQKVVTERLMATFDNKQLQYGFQKGWNAEALLQQLVEKCEQARRDGKQCAVISIDIKAAFDRLRASHVASALLGAGVDPHIARYCHKYVTNRKFQLRFATNSGDHTFGWYDQHAGCVQGSVLGPSLFLYCIQDLLQKIAEITGADPMGYADDVSVVCVGEDLAAVQRVITGVSDLISQWGLEKHWKFSTHKCWILPIAPSSGPRAQFVLPELRAKIAGESIKCVASARVLGVILDSKLKFEEHAERVLQKVTSRSRAVLYLSAQRWGADQSSGLLLYKTIIESLVTYAGGVWIQRAPKRPLEALQTKLTASIRVCLRLPRRLPLGLLYYRSGCMTLQEHGYVSGVALEARLRKLGFAGGTRYAADYERLMPPGQYVMSNFKPASPNAVFCNWNDKVSFGGKSVLSDTDVQKTVRSGDLCVFTDGSVKKHAAAHAYVLASDKQPGALETGGAASSPLQQSYHVELRGIAAGLNAAIAHVTTDTRRVVIFTDSLSSIEKLKTRKYDRELEEAAAVAINDVAGAAEVKLVHAKGHANIMWNEAADAIAGGIADAGLPPGCTESGVGAPVQATVKDARAAVKKEVFHRRRRALLECEDDDISFAALTTNGFAKQRPQIGGRTGVVQMHDLLQLGLYDAHAYWEDEQIDGGRPWCRFCGHRIDLHGYGAPITHLVYDCPAFAQQRGGLDCSRGIRGCFLQAEMGNLVTAIASCGHKMDQMGYLNNATAGRRFAPTATEVRCH